mgnify:CR=1 FL=1
MDRLTVDTTQRGFRDVFFSHGWRVAFSNTDGLGNTKDTVHKMERHMETEEAFVLLQGTVHLVTAGTEEFPQELTSLQLEPNSVYIIRKGEWHVAVFEEESSALIVENEAESYSISFTLTPEMRRTINTLC